MTVPYLVDRIAGSQLRSFITHRHEHLAIARESARSVFAVLSTSGRLKMALSALSILQLKLRWLITWSASVKSSTV